jgi:hypothetical protein
MPEWMISGDSSSSAYASSLVAESPFVKNCQRIQRDFAGYFKSVMWKVLRIAHSAGLFDEFALSFPSLKRLLEIKIDAPIVQSRDRNIETNRHKIMRDSGIVSDQTWASVEGLDLEKEVGLGAKVHETASPFAGGDQPGTSVENQSREPQAGNLGTAERNVPVEKQESRRDPPTMTDGQRLQEAANLLWKDYPGA